MKCNLNLLWSMCWTHILIILILRRWLEKRGVVAPLLISTKHHHVYILKSNFILNKIHVECFLYLTCLITICLLDTGWQVVWFRMEQSEIHLSFAIADEDKRKCFNEKKWWDNSKYGLFWGICVIYTMFWK